MWENSKVFIITLKYFSIFNNKSPASWVAHITRNFLTCYSGLYYISMSLCGKQYITILLTVFNSISIKIMFSFHRTCCLLYLEIIDWHWHQIVFPHPINIEYKYKLAKKEAISFNWPIWLFNLLLLQISWHS